MPNSSLNDLPPAELRLHSVFFPYAFRRRLDAIRKNQRFAHYTSAEAAISIIRSNSILLRNARCLDDFKEMRYGLDSIYEAWNSDQGQRLKDILEKAHYGLADSFIEAFKEWKKAFSRQTYIFCMSEHDLIEDNVGRASMWRDYGARTKVAIILKQGPYFQIPDSVDLLMGPVTYTNSKSYTLSFKYFVDTLSDNFEFVQNMEREDLLAWTYSAFKYAAVSTKPLNLHEEREWRIVYTETPGASSGLRPEVTMFDGVPQKIYRLPFANDPTQGPDGMAFPGLFDRLIIGPTEYPDTVYDAFVALLSEFGVEDAEQRVVVSYTPLP